MTDKSAAAIREFAEKWAQEWSEITGWHKSQTMYDYMLSDLTSLISENYVSKEEVDKMVEERLRGVTERCKKLEFMIDKGLGWDDMKNDITMPHEL